MRLVYEAANIMDAHLIRHALEHAGIPAFVSGEALLGGIGELPASGVVSVAVPESVWDQARDIVQQLDLGSSHPVQDDAVERQGGECQA